MIWHDISVPMKDWDASMEELYHIQDNPVDPEYNHVQNVLDTKFELADLWKYAGLCTHLMLSEQNELYTLLKGFKDLFDGTLGRWTGKAYHIKLKPGAKQY